MKCTGIYSVLRFGSTAAKLIRKQFTVQKIIESSESETLNIFQWLSQSSYLNPAEHAFKLLGIKLTTERPTVAAVKAWQIISKEEMQHLLMAVDSRLQTVTDRKGFSSKY